MRTDFCLSNIPLDMQLILGDYIIANLVDICSQFEHHVFSQQRFIYMFRITWVKFTGRIYFAMFCHTIVYYKNK